MIKAIKININNTMHITNVYIIWDENSKETALIDPADRGNIISNLIYKNGLKLKYVLLTHAHKDHTNALKYLANKYSRIKIVANFDEKEMLEGKYNDYSTMFGLVQIPFDTSNFVFLSENDKIFIGNEEIIFFKTPGHTKGGACYYIPKEKALFTGDTLFEDCFGKFSKENI